MLIPVFRWDVRPLVQALVEQGRQAGKPFEVICLDDASGAPYTELNQSIAIWPEVQYEVLPANIGRAAIRNRLAERASFPWLLFMDCDSMPPEFNFVARYLAELPGDSVLCGGRLYQPTEPEDAAYRLHWRVGTAREVWDAQTRSKTPYDRFMTNNFLCPASLLPRLPFDERITQYGHEDTLWGQQLKANQIPILHIDNPLYHVGLETAPVFLQKTEAAIENLIQLQQLGILGHTRLSDAYHRIPSFIWKILGVSVSGFGLRRGNAMSARISGKLLGPTPRVWQLDLYKLMVYSAIRSDNLSRKHS